MRRVLLIAAKTGYQAREFQGAADRLGIELVLGTDRCHVLADPWADRAVALDFENPLASAHALEARGPFDGILAVGDGPAAVAAEIARGFHLRFHAPGAVCAASDKFLTRERFRAAGLNTPCYRLIDEPLADEASPPPRFPCVLKPLHLSASRGVIRANDRSEFESAFARIRRMNGGAPVLVEDFIPGREFALEGIVSGGHLRVLALFDKPDPLDGPFFEETIYATPSGESAEMQGTIEQAAQSTVAALGLTSGPVHAEMRVNPEGVWMLEAAARPIGGLCARVLRFVSPGGTDEIGLEEVLLRHALGEDLSALALAPGAHGVMMIPIPSAGVYSGVKGLEAAREIADIQSVEITAKEGQLLEPLPEGASYLGFIFSRALSGARAVRALREAHACFRFTISKSLPIVR